MGYNVVFLYLYTLCHDKIKVVSIFFIANMDHFFIVEHSKFSLLAILKYTLLINRVTLLCKGMPELIPPQIVILYLLNNLCGCV